MNFQYIPSKLVDHLAGPRMLLPIASLLDNLHNPIEFLRLFRSKALVMIFFLGKVIKTIYLLLIPG